MTAITYDQLYGELDRCLLNSSRRSRVAGFARRYGEDPDALIADVRLAMWNAFRSYDWNAARGGVSALAERVLRNTLSDFRAARRRDRLVLEDASDVELRGQIQPRSDVNLRSNEWFAAAYQVLNERRRAVFDLKTDPPPEYVAFLSSTGSKSTNVSIGEFLGYKKNQVDWDLRAINNALGAVLMRPGFEELRDEMVAEYGWPMVWASEFANDQELVERIADQQNLDLDQNAPKQVESTASSSRVIETYGWGCICYLRHGARAATLVILGKVKWSECHVFRQAGSISLVDALGWYGELDRALKEDDMKIPRCFGEHDPEDSICKGDPKADSKADRAPCSVRDRCVAFELHCKLTKTKPPTHVKYVGPDGEEQGVLKDPDGILPKLDKLISEREIVNGKIRRATPKKAERRAPDSEHQSAAAAAKPKKQAKEAGKASAAQMEERRKQVVDLSKWYFKRISDKVGLEIHTEHADASAGQLYLVDRSESSDYVSLYAKKPSGGRTPITSVYLRPQAGAVEVRVAVAFGSFSVKGAEPEDYTGKDGAFKVRIRGLQRHGLSLVADAVAELLESGKIALPSGS